jgi:hypothetical protein
MEQFMSLIMIWREAYEPWYSKQLGREENSQTIRLSWVLGINFKEANSSEGPRVGGSGGRLDNTA